MTLAELIAVTPDGGTLNLGRQVFNVEETVRITSHGPRDGVQLRATIWRVQRCPVA